MAVIAAQQKRIGRSVLGLLLIGLLVLLLAGFFAVRTLVETQAQNDLVQHTREVESSIARLRLLVERIETARRGYLIRQDERFRQVWSENSHELLPEADHLQALTADNPAQQDELRRLRPLLEESIRTGVESFDQVTHGNLEAALAEFRGERGSEVVRRIRASAEAMNGREEQLMAERQTDLGQSRQAFYLVLTLAGLLVLLVVGACFYIIRRFMNELNTSREELRVLNTGLEEAVGERTMDLQRANEDIQRFAYIVSHDLRSPLVNIMGFTSELDAARKPLSELIEAADAQAPDLVSREARAAVTEDLPEALGFIRASTQKMDRLINAILTLSREGRRKLAPVPVDIAELLGGVVASLKHRADELGATVSVGESLPTIVTDRLALEQIFSNLVENALKYLSPARAGDIRIDGRQEGMRLIYEVRDNGRGVDPRDHQRIFDLFRRSGVQDRPGEGIGLAHVRSLAWRLGGTIEVESALDAGATFRLSLPETYVEETRN